MTTYAFDGKNFASDSQCTHKKMDSLQTRPKLVEIEHEDRTLFMGIVGETNVHPVVQNLIEDLCLENKNLTSNSFYLRLVDLLQKRKLLEQSDVILYSPHTNSVYEFYQTNGTYGYHKWTTPIAFGSGAQCAMGVLALGLTADYAVVAAGKVDIFTNGPFYYIEEANDYQLSLLESADLIMPERWSEMHSDFFDTFRKV